MERLNPNGIAAVFATALLSSSWHGAVRADEPASASSAASPVAPVASPVQTSNASSASSKPVIVRKVATSASDSSSQAGDVMKHDADDAGQASNEFQPDTGVSPLQGVIDMASRKLAQAEQRIRDYTCMLIKRERIDGVLSERQYIEAKVRRGAIDGDAKVPFSVYLKFLKPRSVAGREVLYVEGQRDGDLLVRRGGPRMANITVELKPTGTWAMRDNRYPITSFGFCNLVRDLVKNMRDDLPYEDVTVRYYRDARVGDRVCDHIEVRHQTKQPYFDYHIASIFIDKQLEVPIYFASYDWPQQAGGQPELQEEYIFTNITMNPGLSDADFDAENPDYHFETVASDDVIATIKQ